MAINKKPAWHAYAVLYKNGYTTQDIAAMAGTSDGTVSKGLRAYGITLRKSGKPAMAMSPTQFSKEDNDVLAQVNLLQTVRKYYDNISVYAKASHIYKYSAERTMEQIAKDLNIGKSQITTIKNKVKPMVESYAKGLQGVSEKEADKKVGSALRTYYFNLRNQVNLSVRSERNAEENKTNQEARLKELENIQPRRSDFDPKTGQPLNPNIKMGKINPNFKPGK